MYHHRTLGDGAEGIHVAEMVKAFRKLGHEVRVVSLIGESTNVPSKTQRKWATVKKLVPRFLYEVGELSYNIPGYVSLSRVVKEFQPDFIYDRYISYNYSGIGVGRRYAVPVVLEVNSPYSFQKQTFDETLYYKRLLWLCERKICRGATRVVVVSTPLKKYLVSIGVPDEKIVIMPNGVDAETFHPGIDGQHIRSRYGLAEKVVIGFTGIFRAWHGLELLIQAYEAIAKERTDVHLLILGDGPIRFHVEQMLADKGLCGRFTVTGRQPHSLVKSFVAAMDIAISPRATFYASPMKILEYMAIGKAIIAPDMENIRDILRNRLDALLFRPEDAGDLEKALRLLIRDPELRSRLGSEARRKIETGRTWLHNANSVLKLAENMSAKSATAVL